MRLEKVLNHPSVTTFGIKLGQAMPRWFGYGLSQLAATAICRFKPNMYQVVKNNLHQVLGPAVTADVLEAKTRAVFVNAGRANYDFFHVIDYSAEQLAREVEIERSVVERIHDALTSKRGMLLLGTHISNFNLVILALGALKVPIQALSLANPNEGFTILNRLRAKWGMEFTPISAQSLRGAIERLRKGGVVLTAFDYPTPANRQLIPFFGKPAYFPLGPARLARLPGIDVLMGSCHYDAEHGYILRTQSIDVERSANRRHDSEVNARRMAKVLEGFVAQHPEQWLMFYPFWPDANSEPLTPAKSGAATVST